MEKEWRNISNPLVAEGELKSGVKKHHTPLVAEGESRVEKYHNPLVAEGELKSGVEKYRNLLVAEGELQLDGEISLSTGSRRRI